MNAVTTNTESVNREFPEMSTTTRKPLTFREWKKAMNQDGSFKNETNCNKATAVVFNAYVSHRNGELTDRGLKAALNWGFNLDHGSALCKHLQMYV